MAGLTYDDPINIQYTSGTTGFPKGATLTHHNILNNGFFVGEELGYTDADRICMPVPLYHCFGMVMGSLGALTARRLPRPAVAGLRPARDARAPSPRSAARRSTACRRCSSPSSRIPASRSSTSPRLRTGIMAGAPCPVEVMRRVVRDMHMDDVAICYGMTETSPVSTQTRYDDSIERRVATVGRPLPHVEVQIVDAGDRRGRAGRRDRRAVHARLLRDARLLATSREQTAEAIDADGWMHTGDLATMDADGYCRIVGRIKDMVIRGGENIYPREIEEFLFTHPDVADAQVVGVPDERYGEELVAWVRPRPGAVLDADAMREFCRARIARFKVPRYVLFAEAFPMTVTGKPQKFKLRELSIARLSAVAA